MATIRGIWAVTAIGGALFVAAPAGAMAADDVRPGPVAGASEGDPLPGGDPVGEWTDGDKREVPASEGDPLPGGDPMGEWTDGDKREVPAAEGDPLPGGDPEYKDPGSDETREGPASDEGAPLPGGDPEPVKVERMEMASGSRRITVRVVGLAQGRSHAHRRHHRKHLRVAVSGLYR